MSGTAIAAVWPIGPRIVAQVLGLPFSQYRPSGAGAVVVSGNLRGTVPAWITADDKLMGSKPFAYGKPVGFAGVDPAVVAVGDYLVGPITVGGPSETFFMASADIPQPIQVVRCNRVVAIKRPGDPAVGSTYYGGDTVGTETPLITGWPASITQGTKGEKGVVNLPGDVRLPWVSILLPTTVPMQLRFGDVVTDDQVQPLRYIVSNAEQTALGWRLNAATEIA